MTTLTLILISLPGNNKISVTSDSAMRAIGQGIVFFLNKYLLCDSLGKGNVMAILRYVCIKLTSAVHNWMHFLWQMPIHQHVPVFEISY